MRLRSAWAYPISEKKAKINVMIIKKPTFFQRNHEIIINNKEVRKCSPVITTTVYSCVFVFSEYLKREVEFDLHGATEFPFAILN